MALDLFSSTISFSLLVLAGSLWFLMGAVDVVLRQLCLGFRIDWLVIEVEFGDYRILYLLILLVNYGVVVWMSR